MYAYYLSLGRELTFDQQDIYGKRESQDHCRAKIGLSIFNGEVL
jgi:hypothetical protein